MEAINESETFRFFV